MKKNTLNILFIEISSIFVLKKLKCMETIGKKSMDLTYNKAVVLSDKVLSDFITDKNKKTLKDLKGIIRFRKDYDYKLIRT